MAETADKSDDLITELAKLMATAPTPPKPVPVPVAAPIDLSNAIPQATPAPIPVRIPGMDGPKTQSAAAAPQAPIAMPETRGPLTGAIRIPGMDQPAPVSTSAPVSKLDFGKLATPELRTEPLSSFTDRLQGGRNLANDPGPRSDAPPAPIRIPSDMKPASESRSIADGPALSFPPSVAPRPAPSTGDFTFDFGFGKSAEGASNAVRPIAPAASAAAPSVAATATTLDPIADLIRAEMDEPASPPLAAAPIVRMPVTPQARPAPAPAARQAGPAPIPLRPVNPNQRSPESDRFAISPGVGLSMRAPANQPLNPPPSRAPEPAPAPRPQDLDPMSEIESLIGEAVRVELSPGPVRVQAPQPVAAHVELEPEAEVEEEIHHAPAPVVPPLTTNFAPRRTSMLKDDGASGAEDAILAAAAATGAPVDRIEPAVADESPYRRLKVKPQRSSFLSGNTRQYVGMAVAGTLLLAAGLGLYWVLNMGRTANVSTASTAPQLTADATPVKVTPKATPKAETDTAKSPVLQKMGGTSAPSSAEQLVSTDQTQGAAVPRDVAAQADDVGENGLANRKVRTVTVRPDGTIVSGDDAVAGIEALPIERPNVPSVPSTETTNLLGADTAVADVGAGDTAPLLPAATDQGAADADATVATADSAGALGVDSTMVAPTPMNFPVRSAQALASAAPRNTSVNAVVGAQTPNGQIDLLGGDTAPQQQAAAATPAPATQSTAAAYVQLGSSPSQADANNQLRTATARYGSLFGGNKLIVQAANLGQKGTWYRVRLPAASLSDANRICAQIKAAGGDCIATNG